MIFLGTVLSSRDTTIIETPPDFPSPADTSLQARLLRGLPREESRWHASTTFRVEALWKGAPSREVTVLVPRNLISHSYPMLVGEVLLVYADSTGTSLKLEACSRIRLGYAKEDSVALGPPEYVRTADGLRRAR